ncbi:MAG: hypothetical protein K1X28_07865 [Parachlamydiales bacterium]|nr:hypothetical protein [Parachlamydiales bacterium]
MRKTITYPLLGLIAFLLIWISLPSMLSDTLREFVSAPFGKRNFSKSADEIGRLQVENRALRTQIDHALEWVLFEKKAAQQLADKEFLQKRAEHIRERLKEQLFSTPAQVIYRDPSLWSSSLWVNVGEKTNSALGKKAIAKNSPVLADGGALVGVVEFVGEKQSRIRLITDSGLCPSVRVLRGGSQNRELAHRIDSLLNLLEKKDDLESLKAQLLSLKQSIGTDWEDGYMAKGEVHGSSTPFWRSRGSLLEGIGFNFDFPDSIGNKKAPLLKEGDLLVTTGLDGVFPPGLSVATVVKIHPQKAGDTVYNIDARPIITNLNDLQTLFILPPISE